MKAPDIIRKAADLVGGERNEQHGDIAKNFEYVASLWSAYLRLRITPVEVATLLELLKIARRKSGQANIDNYVDAAGYAGIAGQLAAPPERLRSEKVVQDAFERLSNHEWTASRPGTRDEASPVEAFERSWTGGALRREIDKGVIKIRDLTTNQIVFELD